MLSRVAANTLMAETVRWAVITAMPIGAIAVTPRPTPPTAIKMKLTGAPMMAPAAMIPRREAKRTRFITKQVNDNISAYDVARFCGTSLKQIEDTYYEDDANVMLRNIEEQKAKRRQVVLYEVA